MNKLFILIIGALLFTNAPLIAQNQSMDSISYSVGVLIAQNLKQQGIEGLESASVSKAINDVLSGNELDIPLETASANFEKYMGEMAAKKNEGAIREGADFLIENGKKDGVVTLPSGLQYKILTEGTGAKPKATDKVTTHYHGTLLDGTVFDSSYDRGQPASFPVNGVIKGWQEALQLMPVGSKWKLFVPYNLAYGERGAGGDIKPFATLIFDVELLEIN